ncbi:MAG: hypothetical protein JNK75_05895 [Betaproteobacteria bacterium]|nr:hypothetical protein [Betaproteobacteria bacterium]
MTINHHLNTLEPTLRRGMAALVGTVALFLAACGGGGTQGGDPNKSGDLAINPSTATMYALNPFTFFIAGGRAPYNVTSSEPTLGQFNFNTSQNQISFTPNQPGVVDVGQDPEQVPSRQMIITIRDANGTQVQGTYNVLQNFLTGYGLSISTVTTCGVAAGGGGGSAISACSGSDSLVSLVPVFNGTRIAGKQMRLTVNYGPFSFIQDGPPDGITGPNITRNADSTGGVSFRIRVLPNVITQYAQFRLTDVATGAFRNFDFVIRSAAPEDLSVIPSTITFTGANTAQCGFGSASLFPLGGKGPYRAVASNPNLQVSPSQVNAGEGFNLTIGPSTTCISASVIVSDAEGKTSNVSVTTEAGATPPILPLTVTPSVIGCLPDLGANVAQVTVNGGNANKVIAVSSPGLLLPNPTAGSGTFVMQLTSQGVGGGTTQNVTVTVSDGSAAPATVTVGRKSTCP